MPNLDIQSLRSFILAERLGSFSTAANNLNCSQAALSFRIKKLENNLGTRLFHRDYHHLRLTSSGKALLPEAEALVKAHDTMLQNANQAEVLETVKLGVPEDMTRPLFTNFMSRYQGMQEKLNIELTMRLCRDLMDMVDSGDLDMAITTVPPEYYGGEQLGNRDLLWVASPDFQYDPNQPIPLALHPHRCIYRDIIIPVFETSGIKYRIAFSAQGSMSVQAAVMAGMGLTVIAEGMVPPELMIAPDDWALPNLGNIDIRLFKSKILTPLQLEFASDLKSAFKQSMDFDH